MCTTALMPFPPRSTGSAGLIQMIQMFARHSWAAAVLSLVATIGWVLQGLGNAFYYRQVRNLVVILIARLKTDVAR
jgi:hypothetical protein